MYKEGQRILERQRFQFPSNWLYSDNIDGEWSAFNDIMARKDSSIQTQVASLQMKIVSEDKGGPVGLSLNGKLMKYKINSCPFLAWR